MRIQEIEREVLAAAARISGRARETPVDRSVAAADGVEVVGQVADLAPELRDAGAVVVPIRWGAGTRIKLIEAMAHRVPVISTTIGAEGLGLVGLDPGLGEGGGHVGGR